uniref:Uncharacterized protein n=1 Tax=Rhizophora mucronata TaxID=61149 RepID=A0A2P2N3Y0_RHIMU
MAKQHQRISLQTTSTGSGLCPSHTSMEWELTGHM